MEFKFGIRFSLESGIFVYGVDEINAVLSDCAKVRELKSEGATFINTGKNGEFVSLVFSGGSFSLIIDTPDS